MPPVAAPTAPPPSFYDNLPAGGEMAAGAKGAQKSPESDVDGEVIKGLSGVYRVLTKIGKLNGKIKPGIDKIKDDIKDLFVTGLKQDPSVLDSGEEKPATPPDGETPAGGPPAASPKMTDESHAA